MKLSGDAQKTLILVIAALLVLWYLKNKASQAADAAIEAVNPTDQNNLANRFFNWAYQGTTGSEGTAGTDLADYIEDEDRWWN